MAFGLALVALAAAGGTVYFHKARSEQFARDAWAHFEARCRNDSGESVYETFPHVNSLIVLKPLPPASHEDLSNQFWYGDPYSDTTPAEDRAERLAARLLGTVRFAAGESRGFDFIEMLASGDAASGFVRIQLAANARSVTKQRTRSAASRFAAIWEDISTPEDRRYWVAGSRLRIIDLLTESLVAERVGFLIADGSWAAARTPNTTCPAIVNGTYEDRGFVLSVLKPGES